MNVKDLLTPEAAPECPPSPATSVASCSSSCSTSSTEEAPKRGWVAPFLLHLHQMLRRENPKIIRWAEDGLAFQILDKEAMTAQILPKYFKNKNFSSFQRQLNYFGFRKWSKARAQFPTYSREHFTRDNYSEMSLVKRQSKKSRKRKASSEEEQSAKRAAVFPAHLAASEKCKPILPRPGAALEPAVASQPQFQPHVMSPLMQRSVFSLPVLSPARKVISGYKLPSIRELSLSSAMPYSAIGPIRPRLMA
ncbi:HSF-type DNA-binding protein [Phytophthora cinnamomi]|uniref:HSF-type DNA-binding protein n=1 Tax=Phytophthora cinnamomi TaxID=4785 RepID=UPI003559AD15|nr:HSF-type DNA-binding protein [Phytophthora cinnamomi]